MIHAINSPYGRIILVYDVWLFKIHSLFFTITVTFYLLEMALTTSLSFQPTAVMFEDTSVATCDHSCFSLSIFIISRNGAFSIRFALTIPVAATPMVFKCLSKAGLVCDSVIFGGLHNRKFDA